MDRKKLLLPLALLISLLSYPLAVAKAAPPQKVKPVKNVILMIADGASLPTLSLARWYQRTLDPKLQRLHLDPYLSGTVLTYCSNAPIGDSAPTTSCYMTGVPSIKGFVSTYPYSDPGNDLVPLDPSREYTPIMTLLEATRILHGRKTGLVFTCEFPHATPADCTAHSYNRKKYNWIVPQMINSDLDVVIGGGAALITPDHRETLERLHHTVYLNDIEGMKSHSKGKIWSLFGKMDLPYDLDRDPKSIPSLAEMTETALKHLSSDDQGFFLMVEGSKVDWAAHANDAVGMVTEFLAFDKACQVALDFAQKDGNTVVIMTSDHGNSGLSIGVKGLKDYSGTSQSQLFDPLVRVKKTADGIAEVLQQQPFEQASEIFRTLAGIELSKEDLDMLQHVDGYERSPLSKSERNLGKGEQQALYSGSLSSFVAYILRKNMHFGFTTNGHTGEDVFLAVYAPSQEDRLMGFNTNIELHEYMKTLLGISPDMLALSDIYFAPHDKVLKGMKYHIEGKHPEDKQLIIKHKGKIMTIPAFSSEVKLDKTTIRSKTPAIYVDKTNLFYINADLIKRLD